MRITGLKNAYFLATLNAAIVGLSFLFLKTALYTGHPLDILMYRFLFSFIVVCIPIYLKNTTFTLHYKNKTRKEIMKLLLISLFYPILIFSFQTFGLLFSTSSEAGILYALTPILTMIMAILFLRERLSTVQTLSIFLSVIGVIFIFGMKEISNEGIYVKSYLGILLLTLSVICFSAYNILSRSLSKRFSPFELSFGMMASGAIFFTIVAIIHHLMNDTLDTILLPLMDVSFILSILYLSVFSSLLTSILTNYTLSKIEAFKYSVFSNLSTIIAIAAGAIFLQEDIFYYHVVGAVLVLIGVSGVSARKKP